MLSNEALIDRCGGCLDERCRLELLWICFDNEFGTKKIVIGCFSMYHEIGY